MGIISLLLSYIVCPSLPAEVLLWVGWECQESLVLLRPVALSDAACELLLPLLQLPPRLHYHASTTSITTTLTSITINSTSTTNFSTTTTFVVSSSPCVYLNMCVLGHV